MKTNTTTTTATISKKTLIRCSCPTCKVDYIIPWYPEFDGDYHEHNSTTSDCPECYEAKAEAQYQREGLAAHMPYEARL